MSKWKTSTPPRKTPILVSDGKAVTITELSDWESNDGRGTLTFMHGVEFGGYEWEYDMRFEDITHWMPIPTVPSDTGRSGSMTERCPHGFRTDGSTNCPFCLNDDWMPVAKDQCHPVTGTPDAAQGIEALAGDSVWERPHTEDCFIYRRAEVLIGIDRAKLCTCGNKLRYSQSDAFSEQPK